MFSLKKLLATFLLFMLININLYSKAEESKSAIGIDLKTNDFLFRGNINKNTNFTCFINYFIPNYNYRNFIISFNKTQEPFLRIGYEQQYSLIEVKKATGYLGAGFLFDTNKLFFTLSLGLESFINDKISVQPSITIDSNIFSKKIEDTFRVRFSFGTYFYF